MELNNQQVSPDNQQSNQQEPKFKWIITDHQFLHLQQIREHLIHARAYQVLSMTQDTIYEAAQASGYDLGRIKMLDELLDTAQVVRTEQ